MTARRPALVLVATPIGHLGDLSPRAVATLADADVLAAEDTRRLRKLLSHAGVRAGRRLVAVHAHNEREMAERLVARVRAGERVAYVTDAGMPGISDPGARLVRACAEAGVPVELVPGPSAALAALVLSGLPTERFAFEGFLPLRGRRRAERLAALGREDRTVVFFEAPHRIAETLRELAAALGPERRVAVARELTKLHEEVWRGTLAEAAARFGGEVEPRGELVVVLAPAAAPAGADDDAVAAALEEAMAAGASARDAASEVARALGVPRRRAYTLAGQLKARSQPAD